MTKVAAHAERGQALVLVLLSLAVVLTIILFVVARSTTDIAISSRSQEAVRAFSAAEAGIENALVIGTGSGGQNVPVGDASYSSSVTGFAEGSDDFVYPIPMLSGDSMTTWFVSHLDDGELGCDVTHPCFTGNSITVCWGNPGTGQGDETTPAIETSVFYERTPGVTSSMEIARDTADPSNVGRGTTNKFDGVSGGTCPISGKTYAFNKVISFGGTGLKIPASSRPIFARVRILYNKTESHPVGVSVSGTGSVLPSQGVDVVSTGSAGDSNRKVQVFQSWPEAPAVFDYAVYSGTGLTKNN